MLLLHTRYQFLEHIREPIAAVSSLVFPALIMLFFVVPNETVAQDPQLATVSAGQMALFSVAVSYMFNLAAGVAEDRDKPWEPYMRTLPIGPAPRMGGRLLNAVLFAALGMIPVVVLAVLLTEAEATVAQVLAGLAVVLTSGLPFMLIGLVIGYSFSLKAAIPITQIVLFPMAFAGGLFMPPDAFPDWLDSLSHALPTRAARELLTTVLSGTTFSYGALAVIVGWSAALAVLAGFVYRRDEGRRFR